MIGAGAVVTRDVPPNSILTGNPARISGYAGTRKTDATAPALQTSEPGMTQTAVRGVTLHRLPLVDDVRGLLTFGAAERQVPFNSPVDSSLKTRFMSYLKDNGIACDEHYPPPIPAQEALAHLENEVIGECAATTRIAESEVSLPIHPYLDSDEVDRVIAVLNTWATAAGCGPEETILCSRS